MRARPHRGRTSSLPSICHELSPREHSIWPIWPHRPRGHRCGPPGQGLRVEAPSRPVRDIRAAADTRASLSVRTRSVRWLSRWVAVPAQPPLRLCCLVTGAPSGVRGTAHLWAWSPGTWWTQSSAPGRQATPVPGCANRPGPKPSWRSGARTGPESPPRRRLPPLPSLVLSPQGAGGRLSRAASLPATLTGSQGRGLASCVPGCTIASEPPPCPVLQSTGGTVWTLTLPLRPVRTGEGVVRTYLSRTHTFN